jgi:hypothetical protein
MVEWLPLPPWYPALVVLPPDEPEPWWRCTAATLKARRMSTKVTLPSPWEKRLQAGVSLTHNRCDVFIIALTN